MMLPAARLQLLVCLLAPLLPGILRAQVPVAPVPPSPFLGVVYRCADAWLARDPGAWDALRDENFIRLLYTLSELSAKPKYRDAADREVRRFLEDKPRLVSDARPWVLWERCFLLSPEASRRFTAALRETRGAQESQRSAGARIRALAAAYRHTGDLDCLRALEGLLAKLPSPSSSLSLAIDCEGASRLVPEPLAAKLRALAAREDDAYLARAHDFRGRDGAAAAMLCVSRYENTGKTGYRELVTAAAAAHLGSEPDGEGRDDRAPSPMAFGHAISLQLAAWRSTALPQHLARAREVGEEAVRRFLNGNPPLEAGLDTLAIALVELHLTILHITAVACPPNTLDR